MRAVGALKRRRAGIVGEFPAPGSFTVRPFLQVPMTTPHHPSSPSVPVAPPPTAMAPPVPGFDRFEDGEHHAQGQVLRAILGVSALLMVVSITLWSLPSRAPVTAGLPDVVPVAHGTETVTQVDDLTDDGRASLIQSQRTVEEHTSLKIQAQGGRDLVHAWAARSGAVLGKVSVLPRKGASQCSTTVTHGQDRNHAMIGHASDPITACRALISGLEDRYPDLAQAAHKDDAQP